ncbi:MAG: S-adenosylmethionine:tRNA ribosyltransferase-isomerase, partial [Burkholderiaceae bacterium]|nr:S-adenosylmethionine:tRNA ribosyltransferase-isomerase [Burkholderiaceae bacterium]
MSRAVCAGPTSRHIPARWRTARIGFRTPELLARLQARGIETVHLPRLHVGGKPSSPVPGAARSPSALVAARWRGIGEAAAAAVNTARAQGRPVVAVGTTSLRALESAAADGRVQAGSRDTALFITPGFAFQVDDP